MTPIRRGELLHALEGRDGNPRLAIPDGHCIWFILAPGSRCEADKVATDSAFIRYDVREALALEMHIDVDGGRCENLKTIRRQVKRRGQERGIDKVLAEPPVEMMGAGDVDQGVAHLNIRENQRLDLGIALIHGIKACGC